MSSVFDDIKKGKVYNGKIHLRHEEHEKAERISVIPYYEGGMQLETYGESKFRGFRRAVARKAPVVAKDIVSTGKRTIVPALKEGGKAILKTGLKIGKSNFEELKKRKAKGINVWW